MSQVMTLSVQQQQPSDPRKTELPPIVTDSKTGRVYHVGGLLGTGGFAKVFRVTEAITNRVFADKVINKKVFKEKKNAKEKVEREIMIHRDLRHEQVVTFVRYFEDSQFVHMVLELCPQKTLLHVSNNRKRVTEAEVRYYTRQIVDGVSYLHSRAILHRDLKLGNMFLSANMLVKIGDFGLASTFDGKRRGVKKSRSVFLASSVSLALTTPPQTIRTRCAAPLTTSPPRCWAGRATAPPPRSGPWAAWSTPSCAGCRPSRPPP